jgi:hypothetical protein
MSSLDWNDLFIEAHHLDFEGLLLEWPGLINGPIRPIGASVFGDLFFESKSGEVQKLDVLEGGVHPVARNTEEFAALMNSSEWQRLNLLSEGVALLKERGVSREAGQFFAFAPHPAFVGKIVWSSVRPLSAIVWNSICAQTLAKPVEGPAPSATPAPAKKSWWKFGRD